MTPATTFAIRPATPADVTHIQSMIVELAVFEKLEHLVVATEEKLHEGLFGPHPACEAIVGEADGEVVTFALFVWFGAMLGLGWLWWVGLVLTALAFGYEHAIVKPTDLSRVNRAFFTANGFVGIVLFVFALADLVLR